MSAGQRPEGVSEDAFLRKVRDAQNRGVVETGHHPGTAYTASAFRHYIRQIALLDAMGELDFATALDVGCSEGYFMRALSDGLRAQVWGVDISEEGVVRAHEAVGTPTAVADAHHLPAADGSFDLVYSTEVIEHVLDPVQMAAELRRVARKWVVVTTPVSQTEDEHEPDFELAHDGHINNFNREAMARLFGEDAQLRSFRNNSTLTMIVAVGRHLPRGGRDAFYRLDHRVAKRWGAPHHRFKPLRNRDWLVVAPGSGAGDGRPGWRCPRCRGPLEEQTAGLFCASDDQLYPFVAAGVPDFAPNG